ncbi:MAG: tRNA (guanosine(37)-N1)-methyltransferase TrmD [Simkaniaceae bacterium]
MKFDILSLFPEYFKGPFDVSMIKRAREKGLVDINLVNIRDYASGPHKTVDDRPYGGGPGMLLMAEPVVQAIRSCRQPNSHVIYLSPQGNPLTAKKCRQLASYDHLILLSGHYEGIDERAIALEVDEEISIGDYVLTSGLPAIAVILDAVVRYVPGVLGHDKSALNDSFEEGCFDAPHYTRPPSFEGLEVPSILLEGHHAKIEAWRKERAREKTESVRPDLTEKT